MPKRRLFDELRKALSDEPVDVVVFKLNELGLFKYLLPEGAAGSDALKQFNELMPKQPWQNYLAYLCCELPAHELIDWLNEVQAGAEDSKAVVNAHKEFSARERS